MSFFQTVGQDILSLLTGVGKAVLAFIEAAAGSIAANGGQVLIDAATGAVSAAEAAGGTAAQKLAAAQASVVSTLEGQGIPVVQNAVNVAIEAAVASMKASQVPVVADPTPATPVVASPAEPTP